jgi:hypothetical protein
VPPCVLYGLTCLLIRDAIGSQYCSVAGGKAQNVTWIHMLQEGPLLGNLSTATGASNGKP